MPSIPYLMSQRSLQQNAAHLRDADRARGESGEAGDLDLHLAMRKRWRHLTRPAYHWHTRKLACVGSSPLSEHGQR